MNRHVKVTTPDGWVFEGPIGQVAELLRARDDSDDPNRWQNAAKRCYDLATGEVKVTIRPDFVDGTFDQSPCPHSMMLTCKPPKCAACGKVMDV